MSEFSLPAGFRSIVFGATGGIGEGFAQQLKTDPACAEVITLSRKDGLDLENETSIKTLAQSIGEAGPVHLLIDATGFLHDDRQQPEKSMGAIDPENLARAFALNATGPLLLLKHFHHLMPVQAPSVFATLSARVGSIEDNRLGGWYAYRMSKAALNMGLKTAAIEIARKRKQAICIALHPGTVVTPLSNPFAGSRDRFSPEQSAGKMLSVVKNLGREDNGSFLAYDGSHIPW